MTSKEVTNFSDKTHFIYFSECEWICTLQNDLEISSVSTYIAKNEMKYSIAILQHMSFAKLLCSAYFEIQLST